MSYPLSHAKHLVVIQPLVGIGDMVWHKPWIDELASQTQLTLAAKPTAQVTCLFPQQIDNGMQVLPIERSLRGRTGRHDGLSGVFRLASDLKKTQADTALILHHSPRYALACALAGIKTRIGYGHRKHSAFITHGRTLERALHRNTHAIDRIAAFAQENGFGLDRPQWQLTPQQSHLDWATSWLGEQYGTELSQHENQFFIFGIGAMHGSRCWSAEKFAQLAEMISSSHLRRPLFILTGPDDVSFMQEVMQLAPADTPLYPLQVSLEKAIAVMAQASGFIGNDSGPLNIMACLGVPALGLFSQSRPLTYSPHLYNLELFNEEEYGNEGLIDRISPDDVFNRMQQIW